MLTSHDTRHCVPVAHSQGWTTGHTQTAYSAASSAAKPKAPHGFSCQAAALIMPSTQHTHPACTPHTSHMLPAPQLGHMPPHSPSPLMSVWRQLPCTMHALHDTAPELSCMRSPPRPVWVSLEAATSDSAPSPQTTYACHPSPRNLTLCAGRCRDS